MSQVGRRAFLIATGTLLVAPHVDAQQPARLAWIGSGSSAGSAPFLAAFREGMRENGLVDGKDFVLDLYWSDADFRRFAPLVKEALESLLSPHKRR